MSGEGYIYPRGFASKFLAYDAVGHIIPTGVWTQLTLDAKLFDGLNEFDETVAFAFTVKQTGYYKFMAKVGFTAIPLGTIIGIQILVNGTTCNLMRYSCNAHATDLLSIGLFWYLTVGDVVTASCYQNSGIGRVTAFGSTFTALDGFRVA